MKIQTDNYDAKKAFEKYFRIQEENEVIDDKEDAAKMMGSAVFILEPLDL